MYQSIRILQFVCTINRALHYHLHDKNGPLRLVTKLLYKINLKVTLLLILRFFSKMNDNRKGHALPTLIQLHIHMTSIVRATFNRNSGEHLATSVVPVLPLIYLVLVQEQEHKKERI